MTGLQGRGQSMVRIHRSEVAMEDSRKSWFVLQVVLELSRGNGLYIPSVALPTRVDGMRSATEHAGPRVGFRKWRRAVSGNGCLR